MKRVVDGQIRVDMLTFHGCENDLTHALPANIEVRHILKKRECDSLDKNYEHIYNVISRLFLLIYYGRYFYSKVSCEDHENACFNVTNVHDDFLTEATACFCDGDL